MHTCRGAAETHHKYHMSDGAPAARVAALPGPSTPSHQGFAMHHCCQRATTPHLILTVFLAMMSSLNLPALPPGTHALTYVSALDGSTQPYNLFVPEPAEPAEAPPLLPLVVVLHGKGATWQSWFAGTRVREWAQAEGYAVVAPHGRGNWFYQHAGERDVLDVLAEVQRLLPIDPDRIYLMGHSMGGFGTWHMGVSHPHLFAAIVPMSSWAPLSLLHNLNNTPVLAIHGGADVSAPPDWSREAVMRMRGLGLPIWYIEVEGAGHESSMISDKLPEIGDWLRGRTRIAAPNTLEIQAFTPARGRAWWAGIDRIDRFGQQAQLVAVWMVPENLHLRANGLSQFHLRPHLAPRPPQPGVIEVQMNGRPMQVEWPEAAPDSIALRFTRNPLGWEAEVVPLAEVEAPYVSPVLGPAPDLAGGLTLPQRVARHIHLATRAQLVAIPHDFVLPEILGEHLTEDHLIDLFLHPDQELVRMELSQADALQIMRTSDWFPAWWGELVLWSEAAESSMSSGEALETIRGILNAPFPEAPAQAGVEPPAALVVVMPRVLARRLPHTAEPLGITVREVLHRAVVQGSGL